MCLITSTVYGAYSEDGDNGSIATADSLNPLPETPSSSGFLSATMNGSFTDGSDYDYWVFDAEAGDEISAWMEMDAAGTYPRLRLLNASETVLKYEQYWNTSMQAFQNYIVPSPGTYYIQTYPYYAPGSEVGYTLRLDVGRNRQLESEDNNFMNQADVVAWQVDGSSNKGRFAGALYNNVDYLDLGHLSDGDLMSVNFRFPDGSALDATKLSYEIQTPDGTVHQSGTNSFFSYDVSTNAVHYLKLSSSTNAILAQYVSDFTIIDAGAPLITSDTLPAEGSTNTTIISSFTVNFSEYMDVESVTNSASWGLITDGGDDIWGNDNDETYTLAPSYSANTLSATLSITDGPIQPGQNVRLTGTTALTDRVGNALSSDYVREFRIENIAEYAFENRNNGSIAIGTPLGAVTNVGDGSFVQTQTAGVGDNPVDVVTADLDGDLNPDLVSANYSADTISILFGNGDGTFTSSTNLVVGDGPRAVAVGHFNGDSYPDLAVANEYSDNISVLLGLGGGQYQPAAAFATGDGPYSISSADLDGDGDADLVTANKNGGNVTVLYGDGEGGFSLPASQGYIETAGSDSSFDPVGTAQGWRSDDSYWEISAFQFSFPFYTNAYTNCYVNSNGKIFFENGSSDGSSSPSSLQSNNGISVLGRDLRTDGDAANDVYVDSQSDQITIRWAGIYYSSTEPINFSATLYSNGVIRLAYGEGNVYGGLIGIGAGDGIAYQTSSRSSSGSMSNAADIVFSPLTAQQRNSQSFTTGGGPRSVIAANLDGGTHPDLVVANYDADTVSVLINNGDGTFAGAVNYAVGDAPQAVVAGDMNGDGILDLVVANYNSDNVSVLLGQGDGTFAAAANYAGTDGPYDLILEDINGDGFKDVGAASYASSRITTFLNQGDGTLSSSSQQYVINNYPTSLVSDDFDGDGIRDLAAANSYYDQLYVYLANTRIFLSENPVDSDFWSGAGRGQLSGTGDQDYWTFSGKAGDQVVVACETPGNPDSSSLYYRLFGTDGAQQLTSFYGDYNGRGQSSLITLPADGRYAVAVSYSGYSYWSEYRVRVTKTTSAQMETENNNNTSEADLVAFSVGTNGLEAVVGGYISSADTLGDYFSLGNLTSGMVVNVSLQMPSSSDLLAETYLVGPDGHEIAFSDNQALWLGGTSADYGIVNTFSNFPTTTFTAEFWMRSSDTSKYGTPISYARDGQINEMILYDHRSFDPHVGGSSYDSGVAGNSGRWVHIAWSWDSVTGTSIMYKDGTAVHTNTNFRTDYSMIQGGTFVLGQEQDSLGGTFETSQAYLGELDNLALWNTVRTPAQIQSDLASGLTGSESGLVGYWNFEDGTADDLTDLSNDIALFGNCLIETVDRVSDPASQASYPTTFEYTVISNGIYYVRVRDALGDGGMLNQYLVNISMRDSVIPYVVSSSLPSEGSSSTNVIDRFTVDFSEEMAVDTATNSANYELRSAGPDGLLDTADDALYTLVPSYSSGLQVSLVISDGPIQSGAVRFTAKTGLQDRSGNPLREQFVQRFTLAELSGYTMENRNNGSFGTATPLGTYVPGETDGSFFAGNQYGVGNNPYAVVTADFDADGHLDFATADYGSDQVSVMLGEGDGSFLLSTNIVVGDQPMSIDAGLINDDAYPDLAVVNYNSDTATVLLGDGLGGFSVVTNLYAGDAPRDILIADMNNDGPNDLVVCCEYGDSAGILLGSGDGNFGAVTLQYCGDGPYALSVDDLDGDGTNDVATSCNNSDDLGVLFGNGDGTLQSVVRYTAGDAPRGVVIADLNADSVADVVVANFYSDTVTIFRGTGGGVLTNIATVAIGNGPWGDILVQDFTGDGRMDLAMALHYANRIAILPQESNGTFSSAKSFSVNATYPIDTAVGDVDEDGLLDILTANHNSHNVTILLGSQFLMLSEIAEGSGIFIGRGRGNIANSGDYDYWSFSGEAGDQAVVAMSLPGYPNSSGLRVDVYRPDGTSFGTYYGNSTGGSAQTPVLTLPTTGRYTVRVSYNYQYWGEYHLAVQCVHPPMQLESEVNDTTGNATVPTFGLRNGRQEADVGGFALFNTGYDYYNLGNLASGTVVQASIDFPSFSSEHPELQLVGSSGTVIPFQNSTISSNGVLNLDGSADYLRTTTTNFSSRTGTVEGWIFPREEYHWGFWQTHDSTAVNFADWLAMFSYDYYTFYFRSGGGSSDVTFRTQDYIPAYEWTHLAFTWEGTTMKVYVNGTLIASRTNATLQDVMDPFACFGRGHNDRWLNGWMDELRVWDRALTLEEVTSVAQQTLIGNENGLVGYWNFDTDSSDLSGNGNDGDLMGDASLDDFALKPYTPTTNVTHVTDAGGIYYMRVTKGNGSVADQYVLHLSMYDSTIPIITDESLPANDSSSQAMINAFTVSFSEEMSVDTVTNSANFDLTAAGTDDLFDTADDAPYTLAINYSGGLTATFSIENGPVQPGLIRFTASTNVLDRTGTSLVAYTNSFRITNPDRYVFESQNNNTIGAAENLNGFTTNLLDGTFSVDQTVSLAGNPVGLASGYFNADTNLDFAVVDMSADTVSILLGNGDNTFSVSTNMTVSDGPTSVKVGMINDDTIPDLAVSCFNNDSVAVLFGDGNGAFTNTVWYSTGDAPRNVVIGDLNNDGIADLATANEYGNNVGVLLGNGDGTFGPVSYTAAGDGAYDLAMADFDADGTNDLAVANGYADSVSVLCGQGDGSFTTMTNLVVGDYPKSIAAADFNLDGQVDLACGNFDSDNVSVFLSAGAGQFGPVRTVWAGDGPHLTVQDLDGDLVPDLLTANEYSDSVSVLFGDGFGRFSAPVGSLAGDGPAQVIAGNFDGQRGLELAVVNKNENTLMILTPNATARMNNASDDGLVKAQYGRGSLSDTSDVDYWTFDGQAGDQLSLAVDFPNGHSTYGSILRWRVYRPDGVQLFSYYNDPYGYGQSAPVVLPVSGDYLLMVSYNYDYRGEYRFRVMTASDPLTLESEANNNTGSADQPEYVLQTGTRSARVLGLIHGNDTSGDYFEMGNLGIGTSISLGIEWPTDSTLSAALSIYGPAGEVAVLSPATNLVFNTVTNGMYYARINDAATTRGFDAQYELQLSLSDSTAPEIIDVTLPDEGAVVEDIISTFTVEFSESMDPATVTNPANYVLIGAGVDGVLDSVDDEIYPLQATMNAGGASVSMAIVQPPLQTGLTRLTVSTALKDLMGNPLASQYVRTFTITDGGVGNSESRYNDVISSATPIELFEAPDGLWTGTGRGAMFNSADVDYFSFSATNGETVVLGADIETYAYQHRLRFQLRDSSDSVLAELVTPYSVNRGQTAPYTIPADGTYYVRVSAVDNYFGKYWVHVMAAEDPLTLETEDNGTIGSADTIPMVASPTNAVGSIAGYVSSNSDNDYFEIGTVTNNQTILVGVRTPDDSGLVPVVSVYNSSEEYRGEIGATGDGSAEVRITTSDTYFVVIRSGENTGGLGKDYILDVEVLPTSAVIIPNLTVSQITLPAGAGIKSGDDVSLTYQVQNTGSAPTEEGAWFDRIVLSSNKVMGDADDYSLGTIAHIGNLADEESYVKSPTVTLPDGISGDFYIVIYTDFGDLVDERLFEGDNISASDSTFAVALADYPDLVVEDLQVSGSNEVGQVISITWTTANRGALATSGDVQERLRILRADNGSELYHQDFTVSALLVGATATNAVSYTTVQAVPHQIVVTTDYGDDYFEYDAVSHASAEQNSASVTTPIYRYYNVNLTSKPSDGGNLSGAGHYPQGTVITVSAAADTALLPYTFMNWSEYGSFRNGSTNYTFMVTRNVNLTANFGLPQLRIDAVRVPSAGGSVTGAGAYNYGSTTVLKAFANPGYAFDRWQEGETYRGIDQAITNVLYTDRVMTAYFRELNPTHTVTTASDPTGVAFVSGAGYYTNGNSVVFSAPLSTTNGVNRYMFKELTLNGSLLATTNQHLNVFSTLQPSNMLVVAKYTAQPLDPQVLELKRNLKNPVPATTNFAAALVFDRSMQTNVPPQVVFTNIAAPALSFDVPTNGTWGKTHLNNDTYTLQPISFSAGDDGDYGVLVSQATDLYGSALTETNAATVSVNATPPDNPTFSVVASNAVSVTVGWSSYVPPADISGYRLYRETNSFTSVAGLSPVGFAGATNTTGVIGGIELDKDFYVAVAAVDVAGNRNPAVSSIKARVNSVIPTPVSPTSTTVGATGARLTWSSYDTTGLFGLAGYHIYWQESDFSNVSGLTPYATVSAAQKMINISGIDRTKNQYFAVVGYNRLGEFNPNVSTVLWQDPYSGTIDYNLTIGTDGADFALYDIYNNMTVSGGATLTIEPGVTLRFHNGTGLSVHGTLTALGTVFRPIVMTSSAAEPQPGDWAGLYLGSGADASNLAHVRIEYGQGLDIDDCAPTATALTLLYNRYSGLTLEGTASMTTTDLLSQYNDIGIEQLDSALLTVNNSIVMNNGTNAVAGGASALSAANVWWGSADGTAVLAGFFGSVAATPHLTREPLLTPAADTIDGVRDVGSRTVGMRYACRIAESMRVSEDSTFAGIFFSDFAETNAVLLSEGGGLKTLYIQFRNVNGVTNSPIAVPINYITTGPSIDIFNLAEGQTVGRPYIVTCAASSPLGVAAS
ncbi:MAG: VCBS repeat-containing protein, partial [Pontiellaceae bacterium]|nr:VCBS repeat-containing protein [Pontiellaceae bacterium]